MAILHETTERQATKSINLITLFRSIINIKKKMY